MRAASEGIEQQVYVAATLRHPSCSARQYQRRRCWQFILVLQRSLNEWTFLAEFELCLRILNYDSFYFELSKKHRSKCLTIAQAKT